jgi:glycosidase
VWLSPVFTMRTEKFMGHGAFHGYWVRDIGAVEARFGDEALLRKLSEELHARGMHLVLDMVWNHVSFDSPLVQEQPDWFHPQRPIEDWDDPEQLVTREVHGLRDLAQENPEVHAWLRERSLSWVDRVQPDGYRIDAVRHMPLDFQAAMGRDLRAHSQRSFYTLGEVFDGDPVRLAEAWEGGDFDSVFDFPLRYAMIDTFCRDRPVGRLGAVLSADRVYPDPNRVVTFLDNHDVSRVATECGGDLDKVGMALDFLLAVRGIPCLTYGTEIGLTGAGEPENRADMRFGEAHPLEARIREDLALRRAHPSLTRGRTVLVALEEDLLVLLRVDPEETAVIAVNRREAAATHPTLPGLTLPPGQVSVQFLPGRAYVDPGRRTVRIRATGLPVGNGETPVLVGTGRELANWTPEQGLVLAREGDTWKVTVALPADSIMEYKLVIRGAEGVRWQEGENRYLFVAAGEGALEAEVTWQLEGGSNSH